MWRAQRFAHTLNYSSVNEDWRTENAALQVTANDLLLCVTGGGDRPLDLLTVAPARIVAIDFVPAQNHLLRLKMAAIAALDYDEYAAFLGLTEASPRWRATILDDRLALPPATRAFWRGQKHAVGRGILYQGRWERHYGRVAAFTRLIRGRDLNTLFGFDDLEEQRRFVDKRWDTSVWRLAYRVVCSPVTARLVLGDPAFYAHIQVEPADYLYEQMRSALHRFLARDSFMMALIFRGRLLPSDLPPYLTPEGHAVLRERLDQIEIVTADLVTYLQASDTPRFTRFSLSDVPSYLSEEGFESLVRGVVRCAEPGSRAVIRQFMTRYDLPRAVADQLIREPELERRCALEDRAFAYQFIIGTVP